jgi:hypothetical protein
MAEMAASSVATGSDTPVRAEAPATPPAETKIENVDDEVEPEPARPDLTPAERAELQRQKTYIVRHALDLNLETKQLLLEHAMRACGGRFVRDNEQRREALVDLDGLGDVNPPAVLILHNIVRSRMEQLARPARADKE